MNETACTGRVSDREDVRERAAALLPFPAIRFRGDLPGGLAAVLGPPADIESSAEARAFVRQRPYSAVRLEIEDADIGPGLRFTHARALYESWRQSGVLQNDDRPCYYVYEQSFDYFGERRVRRGIFGLVPLDAPDICVLPHEETWEENRQRRLQILRDLDASISPILLMYEGRGDGGDLLAGVVARAPEAEGVDDFDNRHRLWVVSDPPEVRRIGEAMQGRHFIIADGHHRYAAARMYHAERRLPATGLILACCVDAHDPGLVIQPIHRVIAGLDGFDQDAIMGRLAEWFEISTEPVGYRTSVELVRSLSTADLPSVGLISDGGKTFSRLQLRSWDTVEPLLPPGLTGPARHLDVTVVTELIVRRALGIEQDDEAQRIEYVNDAAEALSAVERGSRLAILVRPVRLDQVLAVAHARGTVPAKSTSFVPKTPIGLVLHEF